MDSSSSSAPSSPANANAAAAQQIDDQGVKPERMLKESASDVCRVKPPDDQPKLHLTYSAPSLLMLEQALPLRSDEASTPTPSSRGDNSSGSDRGLGRSVTMPATNGEETRDHTSNGRLLRSATEKASLQRHEEENIRRKVADKLSDRRKKKMLQRLATVKTDGTVEFDVAGSARIMPELIAPELSDSLRIYDEEWDERKFKVQPLQIVMLIVGTRGDVQPFIAIGKHLQEYGHRVRLATHANFREFVLTAGLEFYPLGGDPKILAGYMVKNKGFLPSNPSEIPIQRKQIKAIINSLLPACIEADGPVPFRAQAMIANPPAYGHVHVAEYLRVPLHIFFTMPWTPTSEFPHPLARIKNPAGYRMSYQVVDSLIWWGIRSMINDFRKKKLKLRPITYLSGSIGSISDLPTGYIWSPHLVPKPRGIAYRLFPCHIDLSFHLFADWGQRVDVVGFCFLDLARDYEPHAELSKWLQAGAKPIYVGFGSLPVQDPKGMTSIIVKALEETGQRGIISRGWGGLGDIKDPPDFIYLLDNCPHDWLFPQCAGVVHHGGAGTTAAGLKAACPTTVVPIFGDQPFWGEQVHAKGVGPAPIPVNQFTLEKLVAAIRFMLEPEVKERAIQLAKHMDGEDGVKEAVNAFHRHLPKDMPDQAPDIPSDSSFLSSLVEKLRRIFCC
ncbi:sterol 3-beta-glucosyltransferase UGT80A2 isoform X1 [Selaginella moellendorffii]|uniref:sterol 3-beta-glucosyltransferase UGT80A2 isoform X1 n=1 Tax=Selaginella moellendorffii TaxID=88036 RepID=UPI000D1C73B1|nr:sterol 3-beta-glucosyltransferase UGT80A2 isoform X1 [Selaginella moellendorffii]|eukprot:XP_024541691.1 sterol 3-beta-glucosyltransferase UGT80A2 isoform X1 [Selaginella moellendorffii]